MTYVIEPKDAPVLPLTPAPPGADMSWVNEPLVEARPEVWTEIIEKDTVEASPA